MQTIRHSDLSRTSTVEAQADVRGSQSAPIELSLSDLAHVAGGKAPNGNWTVDVVIVDAPNGNW